MGWLSGLISLGLVVHMHKFFFMSVFVIVLYSFKMLQEICKDKNWSRFYSMEWGFIWMCYVIWDQQCIFVKWENTILTDGVFYNAFIQESCLCDFGFTGINSWIINLQISFLCNFWKIYAVFCLLICNM